MFRKVKSKTKASRDSATVERKSNDFRITLSIDFSGKSDCRSGFPFLDSILDFETPGVSVSKEGEPNRDLLENIGLSFGEGMRKLMEKRGAKTYGTSIRSDGEINCMFAINTKEEGQLNLQILGKPEGFDPDEFCTFLEAVSRGMRAEVNCVLNLGRTKKNHLQVISKAFGESLKKMIG